VLRKVALLVLPSQLGESGSQKIVKDFILYVRGYHAGADTEHGYGVTRVRPKPPSPTATYLSQLRALPPPVTQDAVVQSLEQSRVRDLPRIPDGKNVIADLMSFYFRSSPANDLCYRASIGRDECAGLAGSEHVPPPLPESA
jgi:hypothetical protein